MREKSKTNREKKWKKREGGEEKKEYVCFLYFLFVRFVLLPMVK